MPVTLDPSVHQTSGYNPDAPDDEERLLLSIQRGLLGQVTAELRSVSADLDPDRRMIRLRFVFARRPSDSEQDAASSAAMNVIADDPDPWQLDEQYRVAPEGERLSNLRLLAYLRCEDPWVGPEF